MTGWYKTHRKLSAIKGLDPNSEWLLDESAGLNLFLRHGLGTGNNQQPPFAFLLTPTEADSGKALLKALDAVAERGAGETRFNMSAANRKQLSDDKTAGAICDAGFINLLLDEGISDFAKTEKSMRLSSAIPADAVPPPGAPPFETPAELAQALADHFPEENVVIGVIDDGFAIAHPRLRLSANETRVASFWDQEARYVGNGSTVPFGRELLKVDFDGKEGLDTILDTYDGPMPEVYADRRFRPFYPKERNQMPRNSSHGTVVLDLAAGEELGKGANRPVVAVKLPRASVLDTSGAHLEYFILEGMRHILSRAEMIAGAPDPHVVIVASYGFFGGPLDGSSQFERAVDEILQNRDNRVQIVLPSGNGRMERAHAVRPDCGQVGDVRTVKWRSPAGDRTPSVMEVWSDITLGAADEPAVKLTVETPYGLSSAALDFTDVDTTQKLVLQQPRASDGVSKIIAEVVCDHPPLHPGRRRFMIWLAPTALPPPDIADQPALSPSGVWTVSFETLAPTATKLSVWIRRDDSLPGFPMLGRQSSVERDPPQEGPIPLNQKQWDRWDEYGTASVDGTINTLATGQLPVVTGGFGAANQRAARSAAGGPLAPMATGAPAKPASPANRKVGPDCLAPSQVTNLRGIKAANFFGGAKVAMSGTSLAAPLVGYWLSGLYLGGQSQIDGPQATKTAAEVSDATMQPKWKPDVARGGNRFLNDEMIERTFRRDGVR